MAKKKSKAQSPKSRGGSRPAHRRAPDSPLGLYLDNAIYLGLHLVAILVPLIFSRQTYMQFDLPKVVVLRVLALLLSVLWGLKVLIPDRSEVRRSPLEVPLALFMFFVALSTAFSVHLPTSIFGKYGRYEGILTFVSYALIVFVGIQTITTLERLRALAWTTVVTGALSSFYGIAQYVGKDPLTWAEVPFEAQRAFSTLGNPDLLAGYLVLSFPLGLALYLSGSRERLGQDLMIGLAGLAGCGLTWFLQPAGGGSFLVGLTLLGASLLWLAGRDGAVGGAIGGFMILACLLLSFVRGGWVGGLVALALLVGLSARTARQGKSRELGYRVGAMVAPVVAMVVALAVYSAGAANQVLSVTARFASIFRVTEGSAGTRLEIWKSAMEMVKAGPLVGYGPDTFRLKFAQYQTLGYAQMAGYRTIADNAHNYLLQLASMLGVPAFLSFMAVSVMGLWTSLKMAWEKAGLEDQVADRVLIIGYLSALAGYIVHLLFGVGIVGSNAIYWLFLGGVAGVATRRVTVVSWRAATQAMRRVASAAMAVVALPVSVWLTFPYFADVDYVMANALARQSMGQQAIESYQAAVRKNPYFDRYYSDWGKMYLDIAKQTGETRYVQPAIRLFQTSERNVPLEFDNYMFLADAYMFASRALGKPEYLDKALEQVDLALKVKPYSGVASSLKGVVLIEQGRAPQSIAMFKQAVHFHPVFPDPHYYLGRIYQQEGKKDLAVAQYKEALKDDANYTPAQEAMNQLLGVTAPASGAPPAGSATPPAGSGP